MDKPLYPVGLQSFSKLREGGYLYVDKTEYIHKLIADGSYYFLSRPRRFGKSLFISTIEAFFQGKEELFKGLAISRYEQDWFSHPVFHLDLSGCESGNAASLNAHFDYYLSEWESEYGIPTDRSIPVALRFKKIIVRAHAVTNRKVIILVDEYDKPLLDTIDNPELQEQFRNSLRSFYSNLKSMDSYIRFAMLTGVTRFGQMSIFSDLNNLRDISMVKEYGGICGITEDELHRYFEGSISDFARENEITVEAAYEELKASYDGYRFTIRESVEIYNPFSILNALASRRIDSFWFATGTPTFLAKMILSGKLQLNKLDKMTVPESAVVNVSFDMKSSILPVLYQSGYLTIKDYDPKFGMLILGFPNREVKEGFFYQLMNLYTPLDNVESAFCISQFYRDLQDGDAEAFMRRMQSLFSNFNKDGFHFIPCEQHYQDVMYIVVTLLGFHTYIEMKTSSGRIDMVAKTPRYIYIFEFKLDKTAHEAIAQIDDRGYQLPFHADGRELIKVGANFSSHTNSLQSWIIEKA